MAEKPDEERWRAEAYRGVAAQTALFGGVLSVAVAGAMLRAQIRNPGLNIDALSFFRWWALVFIATLAVGVGCWQRAATRWGEPLVSPAFKLTVSCLAPALFAGGAIGACLTITSGLPLFPVLFWVVFYGLALLSLRPFAPIGIVVLGWAFVLTGVGAFIYLMNETTMPEFDLPTPTNLFPAAIMGATFGLYHLIYAVCAWPRGIHKAGARG
jgi:hypothetical protein